jgi:hypothetical protein
MSTKERVRVIVERAAADTTQTPTLSQYQQVAGDIMNAVDAMISAVPRIQMGPAGTTQFVKSHKNVSIDALQTVVNVVEQAPHLTVAGSLDAAAGRDALDFHDAFKPAYDKLGVAQALLGFELDARRALLTTGALQTYSIAKGVARTDVATGIHVRNIKKALKRTGKSAKAKNPPPQKPSADAPVPQQKTSAAEPVPQEVPEKT